MVPKESMLGVYGGRVGLDLKLRRSNPPGIIWWYILEPWEN